MCIHSCCQYSDAQLTTFPNPLLSLLAEEHMLRNFGLGGGGGGQCKGEPDYLHILIVNLLFLGRGGAGEFRGGWVRLGGGGKVDNLGEVGWFGGSWMVLGGSW